MQESDSMLLIGSDILASEVFLVCDSWMACSLLSSWPLFKVFEISGYQVQQIQPENWEFTVVVAKFMRLCQPNLQRGPGITLGLSHLFISSMDIPQKNVLTFSLLSSDSTPRIGNIILKRSGEDSHLEISTPNFLTTTSRGVVPHISIDHYKITDAITWVNVPFETLWVCLG